MITIKSKEELKILREGGRRHAEILLKIAEMVRPGVMPIELDEMAFKLIKEKGDEPSFLNYKPYGASRPYPASICISVNDEIVHGIPNEGKGELKDGDIVSLDLGLIHNGLITDMAITVPCGKISEEAKKLLEVTEKALMVGIKAAVGGATTGDVGVAIERFVTPFKYGIVEELSGHGVGYEVHEDPFVPNFGEAGRGARLTPGMVIAIEPMLNLGSRKIKMDKDGYTYRTADGSISAHFEHTIAITKNNPEILTKL